jgi:hypothetical protein
MGLFGTLGTLVPLVPKVPRVPKKEKQKNRKKMNNTQNSGFIPKHGGYQNLISFQKAEIIYDGTMYFTKRFYRKPDRTIDQMVQAAVVGNKILQRRELKIERILTARKVHKTKKYEINPKKHKYRLASLHTLA